MKLGSWFFWHRWKQFPHIPDCPTSTDFGIRSGPLSLEVSFNTKHEKGFVKFIRFAKWRITGKNKSHARWYLSIGTWWLRFEIHWKSYRFNIYDENYKVTKPYFPIGKV